MSIVTDTFSVTVGFVPGVQGIAQDNLFAEFSRILLGLVFAPDPFKLAPNSFSLQVGVRKPTCGTCGKSSGDHRCMFVKQAT